jgi:hypothetical protein
MMNKKRSERSRILRHGVGEPRIRSVLGRTNDDDDLDFGSQANYTAGRYNVRIAHVYSLIGTCHL